MYRRLIYIILFINVGGFIFPMNSPLVNFIALDLETLRCHLAALWVEDKLRHAARVTRELGLLSRLVIRHTVLRLTRCVGLEEGHAAILNPFEKRLIQLTRVGHGDLRNVMAAVATGEDLGHVLLLVELTLRSLAILVHVIAPNMLELSEF